MIYEYDHFDEFILEGSPLETMTGIRAHRSFIKPSYSLFCRFDLLNPEQMQFVKVMEQIHKWAVLSIEKYKIEVHMPQFNANHSETHGFKSPICHQYCYMTGERISGRDSSMFIDVINRSMEQTIFTDIHNTIIPWHELVDCHIKFIPYLHIKHIYVGCKIHFRIEMVKATVLYFGPSIKQLNSIIRIPTTKYTSTDDGRMPICYTTYHEYKGTHLSGPEVSCKGVYRERFISYKTYYEIPLLYDYNLEPLVIRDFYIEGCQVVGEYKVGSHTIQINFNTRFFQMITDIYNDCKLILLPLRETVRMISINNFLLPLNDMMIHITSKTKFINSNGESIDRIEGGRITFIPLLNMSIHVIDGIASLQMYLESAIIHHPMLV